MLKADRTHTCRHCPKTGRPLGATKQYRFLYRVFPVVGLVSLIWFLVRVIPRPLRATYPCQRLAAPLASAFVVWLAGLAGSILAYRRAMRLFQRTRYLAGSGLLVVAVAAVWWSLSIAGDKSAQAEFVPSELPNSPLGIAKGIHPGRVVWVHEPNATNWDGVTGLWWEEENTDQTIVCAMVSTALRNLTGETHDAAAWDALFRHVNRAREIGDVGYRDGERIAIKINMNQDGGHISAWGLEKGGLPSPQVIHSLLDQLINVVGVRGEMITLYDASRAIGDPIYDKVRSGVDPNFQDVRFMVRPDEAGAGRLAVSRAAASPVYFGSPDVPHNAIAYLPQCVTEADYLINLALLRAHTMAGVTLCGKNHFGSVWFDMEYRGGWHPEPLHDFVRHRYSHFGAYSCLVDLIGHPDLGGKTLLYMIDGLYAAEHQSGPAVRYASFENDWTSSLLVSQDPVAIDSVGLDIIRNEPGATEGKGPGTENYLHEAALANDPPSGTFYDPDGDGERLGSLGVHEHWNNGEERQYSCNLGLGEGIELIVTQVTDLGGETPADLDDDGVVGPGDMTIFSEAWLATLDGSRWNESCDLSRDGCIDLQDLAWLSHDWRWQHSWDDR
jgi:Domain of unknown function (DUF362)